MGSHFLTVDAIIEIDGKIVLIKRLKEPFIGSWAIPGGHVDFLETVEDATIREAKEETGLKVKIKYLVGVYSDPNRSPIKHTVAVAFATKKIGGNMKSGDDAGDIKLFSMEEIKKTNLAFDHNRILKDYLSKRNRN